MLKAFSFRGIRGKLLLLLLVVLLPILLIEAFVYYQRFETRKSEELRANLELARAVAKNFDIFVQDLVHTELVVGLALTASQQITESDRNRILDESQAENPAVRSIFWMNDQGLVIASSLQSYVGFNLSDRSFFQRVKEGQKWAVSELIVGRATNKPGFTVSRGIRNKEGELLGIVAAAIEPDRLDTVLGVERARDAGLSLIDSRGMHVYRHPVTKYSWEQRDWLNLYPIIQDSLEGREVTTIHTSKLTGKNRLVAFAPVSSIGWVAAASSAEDEVMKEITSTLLFQAGLGLLVMLAAFGAAVVLSRPISNSIIGLRNYAWAIGRGQMESVAPITAPEELKDLAVAFDRMAEEIRSREAALRESEEKARNLIRHAPAAVYELDVKGTRFLSVNEAMCEITGYTREELLAMSPISMVDESSRAAFRERIKRKLAGDKLEEVVEYRVPTKDGRMLIVAIHASSFSYRDGKPETVLVIAHDVTERKRAEEALRKAYDDLEMRVRDRTAELSQALEKLRVENIQCKLLEDTLRESENQVRFFASQCLTAQETERKRIAGELHDSIAASLGAVRLRIDRVAEAMQKGPCGPESLQDIASAVTVINHDVRRIMADLRPSILDDLGIIPALTWLCREYQKTYSHLSVEHQLGISEHEVPDSLKTPIFRICQEAMNNIAKYSKASLVNLSLKKRDAQIGLTIQDNGQGFDLETVKKGMGLSTMRERAQLSGGSFDLESALGKGTAIRVLWPLTVGSQ